jgi:amidase
MPSLLAENGFDPFVATASQLQLYLQSGKLSSQDLLRRYLEEIDKNDGYIKAITSLPPREWLFAEAQRHNNERASGKVRGPMHVIPILFKVRPGD